jgi:hypothetical protein
VREVEKRVRVEVREVASHRWDRRDCTEVVERLTVEGLR